MAIGVSIYCVLYNNATNYLDYPFIALIILILSLYSISVWKKKFTLEDANYLIVITTIVSLFGRGLLYLRNINDTANILLYVFLTTMAVDTFAYFVGVKIGKHKLNFRVSPKKSIEGSIGGIIGGLIVGITYAIFIPIDISADLNIFLNIGFSNGVYLNNFIFVVILTFIITLIGQLGNFIFSCIK